MCNILLALPQTIFLHPGLMLLGQYIKHSWNAEAAPSLGCPQLHMGYSPEEQPQAVGGMGVEGRLEEGEGCCCAQLSYVWWVELTPRWMSAVPRGSQRELCFSLKDRGSPGQRES